MGADAFQNSQRKWITFIPELSEEDWEEPTEICFQDIISTADLLIQFKFIHHLHYTPARLVKMSLGRDIACTRCNTIAADFFHMFWACSGLSSFWKKLFAFFYNALLLPIPHTPEVGLLGVLKDHVPCTHVRTLLHILLFFAHKTILLYWKDVGPLSSCVFFHIVNGVLPKFKLIYKSRACPKKFTKIWQPWLDVSRDFWSDVTGIHQSRLDIYLNKLDRRCMQNYIV